LNKIGIVELCNSSETVIDDNFQLNDQFSIVFL